MAECLNFILKNEGGVTNNVFPTLCEKHLGRKPFVDVQVNDQRFKTWRVPSGDVKIAVTILDEIVVVSTSFDWDFLWEQSQRERYVSLLDSFEEVFSSKFSVLAPSGLVIGPSELILLNFNDGAESALKRFFERTLVLNETNLAETERLGRERETAFTYPSD